MGVEVDLGAALGTIIFLRPLWLLALPLALWLLWRVRRAAAHGSAPWHALVDARLRPHVIAAAPGPQSRTAGVLAAIALVLCVLALAGIARPGASAIAWRADVARVLVVELSPAMAAGEGAAAPIARARLKLLDLLSTLPGGQTALLVYAEEPYLVAPLTTDAATIALLVPELAPEAVPLAGDQPVRALRMAAEVLARSGAVTRDLVWMTAAANTDVALEALTAVAAPGLRVSVLHFAAVADPRLSTAVAAGGGVYLGAQAERDDVVTLAAALGARQHFVTDRDRSTRGTRELGPWLVAVALPLVACAFRRGVLLTLMVAVLAGLPAPEAFASSRLWANADQRGLRLLDAGAAEAAARTFADPHWRAVALYRAGQFAAAAAVLAPFDDARSHYNRGNALARLGRLEDARDAYTAAQQLRPDDADIAHNLELVRRLLEPENPPPTGAPEPDADPDAGADAPPPTETDAPPEADAPSAADAPGGAGTPARGSAATDAAGDQARAAQQSAQDQSAADADGEVPPRSGAQIDPEPQAVGPSAAPGAPTAAADAPAAEAAAPRPSVTDLPRGRADPEREAAALAEQWLRRVPDEPAGLLRRKLLLEHERRHSAQAERPWQ